MWPELVLKKQNTLYPQNLALASPTSGSFVLFSIWLVY
jgi:hypothetical protein